ncbi:hap5 protein-like [Oryza sativa Japonica Group]|uniref:Hap5 protein-like n=2 Tax=Oryza sativa subsp. japonica TaxID=39947 RepID=Q5Z8C9_ORYSJ|nr:hap5 protein-like [Oryza sativa Japonica Group]BAD53937.1 hap5 protein-like [Oryza sativa Japonica Group]
MKQTLDVHRSLRPPMPMAQQQMDEFWRDRQKEIEMTKDFSEHMIPMARLKKIVSSQKGNMMMTFDMPAFLSKMCELFVQELAARAWACAQSHNRCIILDMDIAEAVASTESYDFLVDILHNHSVKQKSTPCSSTKRCRLVDQPSTSHIPHQHLLPQFAPTYTLAIPITPSLMPLISQCTPSSFPSLPQEKFPLMAPTPIVNRSMLFINNIGGQEEQHEKETNVEWHHQNEIYESIDIRIINATTRDGNKCSISWDELGMADDSLLDNFLEELQVRKDDVSDTRIAFNKDPFLDDAVLSNPSTSNGNK